MRVPTTILVLLLVSGPSRAAEPTLARLSFWVPPERMDEFAGDYQERVTPILKRHGFAKASERGRATVDSVFSQLYAFQSPDEVSRARAALEGDAGWQTLVEELGATFVTAGEGSLTRYAFGIYRTPARVRQNGVRRSGSVGARGDG